jgi:hypothetical protein
VRVYALTSSETSDETLDLFLSRDAAEAELWQILEGRTGLERRCASSA